MPTINIDFHVFKELTRRRQSEEMTENEVIRDLLGLPNAQKEPKYDITQNDIPWVSKGVSFPHGSEFRATYKGQTHTATVQNGALVLNGERFLSPSAAAMEITGTTTNGWRFWECLQPGDIQWRPIADFRKP